jgi:XTP/dITP diphosphohydrolase
LNAGKQQYILASANRDKVAEIRAIFAGAAPNIVLLERPADVPDVDETGDTLEANARLKAEALARATGRPAIADDTGLEVDALGGAPGVYSARYSGEDATYESNCTKLLAELDGVAPEKRTARFTTVAIACWPDGRELFAVGAVEGVIATMTRGDGGFGYDPLFIPDERDDETFAEMTPGEKHALSHRGRAFRALAAKLSEHGGDPLP